MQAAASARLWHPEASAVMNAKALQGIPAVLRPEKTPCSALESFTKRLVCQRVGPKDVVDLKTFKDKNIQKKAGHDSFESEMEFLGHQRTLHLRKLFQRPILRAIFLSGLTRLSDARP